MPIHLMTDEEIQKAHIEAHNKIHEKYREIKELQNYIQMLLDEYAKRKEDNLPF